MGQAAPAVECQTFIMRGSIFFSSVMQLSFFPSHNHSQHSLQVQRSLETFGLVGQSQCCRIRDWSWSSDLFLRV